MKKPNTKSLKPKKVRKAEGPKVELKKPEPSDLVSVYLVAKLERLNHATTTKLLMDIEPTGSLRGHPAWRWADAKRAVDEWRAKREGDGTTKGKLDALKVRKMELEIDRLEGMSIPRDVLAEKIKTVIASARSILVQRFTVELPSSILQGLPADAIRDHCVKAVNEALGALAELGKEFDA